MKSSFTVFLGVCRVCSSVSVHAELIYCEVLYKLSLSLRLIKFGYSTICQPCDLPERHLQHRSLCDQEDHADSKT